MLSMTLLMLPMIPEKRLVLALSGAVLTRSVAVSLVMLTVEEASLTLAVVTLTAGPLQVTVT